MNTLSITKPSISRKAKNLCLSKEDYTKVIKLLNLLSDFPTWTKHKHQVFNKVNCYLERSGLEKFSSDSRCSYKPKYKGEYNVGLVPWNKMGFLIMYRGKQILLVAYERGRNYFNQRYYGVVRLADDIPTPIDKNGNSLYI